MDLTEKYNKAKEEANRLRREMMATPEGMLVIEKTNLENSLKQISDEVKSRVIGLGVRLKLTVR
jgi:hypothetical protein